MNLTGAVVTKFLHPGKRTLLLDIKLLSCRLVHNKVRKNAKSTSVGDLRQKRRADAVIKWNVECSQLFGSAITKSYMQKQDTDYRENRKKANKSKNIKKRDVKDNSDESVVYKDENFSTNDDNIPLTYSQHLGKLIASTDLYVDSMKLPRRTKTPLDTNNDIDISELEGPAELNPDDRQTLESLIKFPLFEKSSRTAEKVKPLTDIEAFERNFAGAFPSVTTILNATRPPEAQFFLDRWKQKMIEELGEEGFMKFQQDQLDAGNKFHRVIEQHFEGKEDLEARQSVQSNWDSIQPVLRDVSEVKVQEGRVRHPDLHYCGVLDCLAEYRGNLCVMEWKMSKKLKPTLSNTFDYPLQVAAYIGAHNFDEKYTHKVKNGLIVISYNNGAKADAHLMSPHQCGYYWGQWLRRLHCYWDKVLRGLVQPPKSYL